MSAVIHMNNDLKDSLKYCKLALGVFIILTVISAIGFLSMMMLALHITPMDIRNSILAPSIPLVFAILIYFKLAKPLELGKKPSKPIFIILTIIGYFAGLVIAGIFLYSAYEKLPKQL